MQKYWQIDCNLFTAKAAFIYIGNYFFRILETYDNHVFWVEHTYVGKTTLENVDFIWCGNFNAVWAL